MINYLKPLKPSRGPWTPDAAQRCAVKFLLEHAAAALLLDPGHGKTSDVYATIKVLRRRGLCKRALVVAPPRPLHMTWPEERDSWDEFRELRLWALHGDGLQEEAIYDGRADVYLTTYEGLMWLGASVKGKTPTGRTTVKTDRARIKKFGFDYLVIDELSKYKETASLRFKNMKQFCDLFPRRHGLTGSPAAKNLMGLFGQAYVLDSGKTLGPYVTHYRNQYFDQGYNKWEWTLKEGAEKQIYKAVKPLMLRLEPAGNAKLPPYRVNDIRFKLPAKAADAYRSMAKDFLLNVSAGKIVAANAGVKSGKLRQIANGGVWLDPEKVGLTGEKPREGRKWVELHREKDQIAADLAEELQGEPLLVLYDFEHDLERLLRRLGPKTPYLGGGVSTKRAQELQDAWNRRELPILLGHPGSMGHGLNLQQGGHHVYWHSLVWDFELYDQAIRRLWRRGQQHQVTVHRAVATGTIDEDLILDKEIKGTEQSAFFKAMLRRLKEF